MRIHNIIIKRYLFKKKSQDQDFKYDFLIDYNRYR